MSYILQQRWEPGESGMTRRDRRGCDYGAYVPDLLGARAFTLFGDVAADVADAEAAITRLNANASALADTEAIARLLLRAEAVASSKIEGLEIGPRRLLRAEAARALAEPGPRDVSAEEVLGAVEAMSLALAAAVDDAEVTGDTIREIHARLLSGTRHQEHGGQIRQVQNWIGGSDYNPCSASFVPPPPESVPRLLDDLAAFCSTDSLPAVAQAAIAHAQFETIHPFVDGNGRTGRALIHLVLRRRGLAPRAVPPISLVLATLSGDYIGGLTRYRYLGESAGKEAMTGTNEWIAFFAGCCRRAVDDAVEFERAIDALKAEWRERLGKVRRGSATDLLVELLPGCPIVTANTAARMLGRTFKASNRAIGELVDADILVKTTIGRRNRVFEAAEAIDEFTDLERRLASPERDTRTSPPARPVPRRR